MVEIEVGKDFSSIYVSRVAETRGLLRKLFRVRDSSADYWPSWNQYTKTHFETSLSDYDRSLCSGHSWTFNTALMAERLKKLVGNLPLQYKTEQ